MASRSQKEIIEEFERVMSARSGRVAISRHKLEDGAVCLDYKSAQNPNVIFRATFNVKGEL